MGVTSVSPMYPANNYVSQAVPRGWLSSMMRAPARFRSTGMVQPAYGGDLITAQTVLRGVSPIEAATVALARHQQTTIQ